ncbi:MAG: ArsR/SmtB family transcription factor [Actinocrinis sp.]
MTEPNTGSEGESTVPSGGAPVPEVVEERKVTDLETLRLLADPLRLSILGAFPSGTRGQSMSVKEIAERLDEGQTKLYRHVKKLEEAGLLLVAETRVVSGIIEKRYRPAQKRLLIESDMLIRQAQSDDYTDTMIAIMDAGRDRLRTEIRAGHVVVKKPEEGPDTSLQLGSIKVNMTPERYAAVRAAVTDLLEKIGPSDEGPDAVPVYLHALLYATVEPATEASGE